MNSPATAGQSVRPQQLRSAFHAIIRSFGLLEPARTPCGQPIAVSHAHALMELLDGPPVKQGDLAGALGLTKSAVSRMVVELERRGWIERRPDQDDGRVRRLKLTASGKRLARQVDEASLLRFSTVLEAIPPAQRAEILLMLQVLQGAIPTARDRERGTTP